MAGGGSSSNVTQYQELDPTIKKAIDPVIKEVGAGWKTNDFGKIASDSGIQSALNTGQGTASQLKDVGKSQLDLGADIANQAGRFGEGIDKTKDLANQAIEGTGVYDDTAAINRQLGNLQGNLTQQAANSGSLTSARQQAATQGALADRAYGFNQQRKADVAQGLGALQGLRAEAGQAAGAGQQYQQSAGDAIAAADEANLKAEQLRQGLEQQKLDAPYQAASRFFGLLSGAPQGGSTETTRGGK